MPFVTFRDEELPRKCSEARGSTSYESARYAWVLLMTTTINYQYSLGSSSQRTKPLHGPATVVQMEAAKRLAVAADLMCSLNPGQVTIKDFENDLKKSRIGYDGSEVQIAEKVTAASTCRRASKPDIVQA